MYYVGIDIAKNFHIITIIDENDMKNLKKRILTNLAVTFPEFEYIINPFTNVGLALLDKYPTCSTL
jgi:hypothetical protein